jgi:ribonuclease HI
LITIYTDGASSGNPGPGAYAAILQYNGYTKELVQGFRKTTNNRMELWAVISALEALKKEKQDVIVYSDSRYVVDAINKYWLETWIKKDFKGKKNSDLWKKFYNIYKKHQVTLHWIKGHAGNPTNERCDKLATERIRTGPFDIDINYEQDQDL